MKVIKADVGEAFPDNDQKSPDVVRLMIASNVIRSLQRAFLRVNSDDYDQEVGPQIAAGDRLVIYLLTIGVLKEAMDAFRTLDSQGWFRNRINMVNKTTYERVAKACDKNNKSSLYARVAKPLRDEVAFHWKRNEIEAALRRLPKETAQDVFVSYSGKGLDSRHCLADEILVNILTADTEEEIDIRNTIKEIVQFSGDFHDLVDICVGSHLKEKGAKLEERE
ncbi:MAG: hypothetical protein ACE5G5_10800 [Candidatus Methylomirabilales bacterium]